MLIFCIRIISHKIQEFGDILMKKNTTSNINNINLGETVPIKLNISALEDSALHWHPYVELIYVLSGELNITVKEQEYKLKEDDLLIVNPFAMHSYQSEMCVVAILQIHQTMFDRHIINSLPIQFECNSSLSEDKSQFLGIKQLLARLIKTNTDNFPNAQILNKSFSYNLLYELTTNFSVEIEKIDSVTSQGFVRMEEILGYINTHYSEKISLTKISENTFLTEPYLSRLFKKNLGINFSEYLTSIRLSHATKDLLTTNDSIEDISNRCGFPNTRSFSASFKNENGVLPGIYRKHNYILGSEVENHGSKSLNLMNFEHHNYLGILAKYLDEVNPEKPSSGISKKYVLSPYNVNQKGICLKHNFRKTTTIGKAKHILYANNQEMLKELQKDIGFEYIKFHGLLDDDMMIYSETSDGKVELSFTYVDMIIDFLLSINLRPFMQLSFMPKALAITPDRKMFYNASIISFPNNMEKWVFLINSLVEHLISRYGSEEIEKWPFLLWNEPDTSEILFGFDNRETFFDFYKHTYNAVKKVNPNLVFGTPSLMSSSITSGTWMTDFMKFCKNNDCIPDVYIFHFYPISIKESPDQEAQFRSNLILVNSENALKESILKIKNIFKDNEWETKEIFLTEWNSTVSHRDWLNDTVFKSAYVTKNILENYDNIESFGYWVLTDFMEELKIAVELFHGGLGLFTYNGIKKSHYYAFKLMSTLGDTLIGKGEGFFLTKSKNGFEFIFYNYQHFSELYASGELFDMTFSNRYTPFLNPTNKLFELPLFGLENTSYIIKETIINREHGSSFDKWIECGALPLDTDEEVQNLKSISVPQIQKRKVTVENNCLTLKVDLKPHEVRGVSIYKCN